MKKIFIWGTGYVARTVFNECRAIELYEILGAIDNDTKKVGLEFCSKKIFSPQILEEIVPDAIVVLTDSYEQIKQQIRTEFPLLHVPIENKNFFYKESVLQRYADSTDEEIQEIVEYIKENGMDAFNYPFIQKYNDVSVDVLVDNNCGLFYLCHNGKKMYFPRYFETKESVLCYYRSILLEQDEKSPHRYLTKEYNVKQGDVVLDVGAAEGNFSLEIIDIVSRVYLIEADERWIEALEYTFKDYMDKVTIIHGYVSSYCHENCITLDEVISESVNFIKMDIEGNEWDALCGAVNLISKSSELTMAICSYHRDWDQELIESFMSKNGLVFEHSAGYMWFPYALQQRYVSTKLNRGIVWGKRQ